MMLNELKNFIKFVLLRETNLEQRTVVFDHILETFSDFEAIKETDKMMLLVEKNIDETKRVILKIMASFGFANSQNKEKTFPNVSMISVSFQVSEGFPHYREISEDKIDLGDVGYEHIVHSMEFRTGDQMPRLHSRKKETIWAKDNLPAIGQKIGILKKYWREHGFLENEFGNFPKDTFVIVHYQGRGYFEYVFIQKIPKIEEIFGRIDTIKRKVDNFLKKDI